MPWCKIVWFPHHVPRWAIIEWMAILGILSTKDRLLNWGIVPDGVCVLCGMALGTHTHICFLCSSSASIWSHCLHVNKVTRSAMDLRAELIWATNHRSSSSFKHSIFKLSLAAVLYGIWCERNRRVFQRQSLSSMDLIAKVTSDLRASFISWRKVKKTDENCLICLAWSIPPVVFLHTLFYCFEV